MAEAEATEEKTAGTKACDATTIAFASFLRSEAEAADSRAKQLWAQAEKLIHDHGLEQHFQSAPKKPGRKPKRKRANDPDRKKPKLTGYTLFMKEANSTVREENPSLNAQNVVQRVAQLWNEKSEEQKQEWKSKAEDHSNENAKKDEGIDKEKATSKREDGNEKVNADKAEDNEKVNADKAEDSEKVKADKAEDDKKDQTSEVVQLVV